MSKFIAFSMDLSLDEGGHHGRSSQTERNPAHEY